MTPSTEMDVQTAIRRRHSTHRFADQPVAEETLCQPGHWTVRLDDPHLVRELDLPSSVLPVGEYHINGRHTGASVE